MLKAFALILALSIGQNGAFLCLVGCAPVAQSAGCHQPSTQHTVRSNAHCVQPGSVPPLISDGAARIELPAPAVSVSVAVPVVLMGHAFDYVTVKSGTVASPPHCRQIPLRI